MSLFFRKRLLLLIVAVSGMLSFLPATAVASQYGCTVVLCLSNPNGPEAVAECIDPIQQLRRDLRRGLSFPSCEDAESSGGTRIQFSGSRYEPCPSGTRDLPAGEYALPAATESSNGATVVQVMSPVVGIGDGANALPSGNEVQTYPPKTCVGQLTGTTAATLGDSDSPKTVQAGLYDQVIQIEPADGTSIDVYVNNTLYRRVQWK